MSHQNVFLKTCFISLLSVVLLYSNILNAPFYFDDYSSILYNPSIRMEKAGWIQIERLLRENPYSGRSIPFLSFGVNYLIGGFHPFGYHLLNVIIHLLNTCLVCLFALKTLSLPCLRLGRENALAAAFLTAFLWTLHPIQTNVATYIVQRMTSLATLFFLLSFLAYIQGRHSLNTSIKKSLPWFLSSLLLGVLSVMCKENTAFLPFLILAYDCIFFRDSCYSPGQRFFWGLLVATVMALAVVQWFGGMGMINRTLNNYVLREFTVKERLLSEMRVVFHYLGLLLVPDPERLTLYNDCYPISRSFFQPWSTAVSCLGLILIGVSLVFAVSSKSPAFLIYAFGILWYFANLAEESSFLCLELVFEHRSYLPSVGIFLIMSFWIVRLKSAFIKWKFYIHLFLAIFIFLEIFGTVLRNQYWSNKALFNEHALERAPDSTRVLSNLSIGYSELGVMGVSRDFLEKALEKKPEDIHLLVGYYLTLMDWKQEEGAKDVLAKINGLLESGKYSASPNDILGLQIISDVFYGKTKDYKGAIKYLEYIIKKLDTHTVSFFKLGLAYLHSNQPEEALGAFKKVMELKPDASENNFYLALTYKILGRDREAIPYVKKALELSPNPDLIRNMSETMRGRVWSEKRPKGPWPEHPYASGMIFSCETKPSPLDK